MSEGLRPQLLPLGIGVSVLCPDFVRTKIGESGRNRQERYGETSTLDPGSPAAAVVEEIRKQIAAGLDPADVAARVLAAIETRNSTSLPIRTCVSSWRPVLPRSRRPWIG